MGSNMWDTIQRFRARVDAARAADHKYGLVLSGGGARASYQAGVLRYISEHIGEDVFSVITGVSAGSLNAAFLANNTDSFSVAVGELVTCWESLTSDDVYEVATGFQLLWNVVKKTGSDDSGEIIPRDGLVKTDPLRAFLRQTLDAPDGVLSGIRKNIDSGRLDACAFVSTNYATGQTVSWIDGREIEGWERSNRVSIPGELTVEHVMASSSLPFLFPAVQIEDVWYGDGGIRLSEPLSPAVHLGASRILAISTRYNRTAEEASTPATQGYPPAAQIFGLLLNAIFLDRLDQDAMMMNRINNLLRSLPRRKRNGMRPIDLLVLRPSTDLGKLSGEYEKELVGILKIIAHGLGSKDTKSPDWLSMILFEPAYASRLMEIGYNDGRNQRDKIARFFDPDCLWTDPC
jgi:NTE family protein